MKIDCVFKAERTLIDCYNLLNDINTSDSLSGNSTIVKKYEDALAQYFNVKYAIAVSSGTAALHASIAEIIKPGEEVLIPVICVPMTAAAILQAGGIPVFYDCDIDSFKPSLESLSSLCSEQSRILITVSMWGYPAIDNQIIEFARKKDLVIIEDTAQGAGTKTNNKFEGTIGDIGCFSTHEFKLISTGEGGFVLTNHDQYADNIRSFAHIGFSKTDNSFGYRSGLNYKLSSLQSSLGINQLSILEKKIALRNEKISLWKEQLSECNHLEFFNDKYNFGHNGYSLCCTLNQTNSLNASTLAHLLFNEGINTDTHRYKESLIINYPFLKKFYQNTIYTGELKLDFPNATTLMDKMIILPCHDEIYTKDIEYASSVLKNILK
ncbi:DegT/DnrJ/EryC1/StrS family aminotransferase [Photorhabdus cinerea]|uniref:Aminotransferase n=1 Tax=Photorhabdus cinerea TaxID=471575 RepID=A0A7X5THX6_9GAMM|nr:DegT/DnrJ/EryC1/StrS family aminotransferase [Photorhabdus cinerea]NHB92327.1 aminotransferase [Photorhabdus cinerea]